MPEKHAPPLPADEKERLRAVKELDMFDTPAEARFDKVPRLAQRVFEVPFAMVTLIDETRQWFKSAAGHLINESPRAESFCQFTIAQNAPLIVHDASKDPRYFDLPVVFDMGIRFYAGAPIRNAEGKAVGTLCILDTSSRDPDTTLKMIVEPLEDMAGWVQAELRLQGLLEAEQRMLQQMDSLRRRASLDQVTRCWNSSAGHSLMESLMEQTPKTSTHGLGVALISLDRLSEVNERLGEEVGNFYLRAAADRIRTFAPEGTSLCRGRTASFLLLWPRMPAQESRAAMEYLAQRLTERPVTLAPNTEVPMSACIGMSVFNGSTDSPELLLEKAGQALSKARKAGSGEFRQAI